MKRRNARKDTSLKFVDVEKTVQDYINKTTWEIRENANLGYSFSSIFLKLAGEAVSKFTLLKVYPKKIAKAHVDGDIHLHNLNMGIIGYCAGWGIRDILLQGFGGVPGKIEAAPPKHLSTVLSQLSNFIGTLQNEWAGAQAFNSLDGFLAPFVRKDKLDYRQVKQEMQQFIYNLNISSRWGGQTPFTNITFDLKVPEDLKNENVILDGKIQNETYSDYQEDMDVINKAFMDVMASGDMNQRIFTFPIPTYNITKDFDWDSEVADSLFKMTARYGIPYFQNFIKSDLNPRDIRAMCCRLQLNLKDLYRRVGGFFGYADKTGCYDEETEILTENGWKHFKELEKEDKVTTLNTKTGEIEYQNPIRFFEYNYNGEMIRINSKSIDLLVTPNHNMFVERATTTTKGSRDKKAYYHKRIFCRADELFLGNDRIPKIGRWKGRDEEYFILPRISFTKYGRQGRTPYQVIRGSIRIKMDDWLKFLGIYLAEGHVDNNKIAARHGYRVFISQMNKKKKKKIKEMLDRLPFNYYEDKKGLVICNKQLWSYLKKLGNCYSKFIPKEFKWLSSRQLSILLDWMIMGDGYTRRNRRFYWTSSKKLADDVQEIFLKIGSNGKITVERERETFIRGRKITPKSDCYLISEHISKSYYMSSTTKRSFISRNKYKGKVYCCEVPNHVIYVRRNGSAIFCGNSVGVVTINMPRIGYTSKNEGQFFERLGNLMELAKESLEIKRKVVRKNMEKGLLPFSKRYLGTLKWHFATIGLIGMNEACLNFLGKNIATKEGQEFSIKVLRFMRDKIKEFQKDTGNIYNLEATPAEGTSYVFALSDKKKYPKIITAGEKVPYYTNSTNLPVNFTSDIFEALKHQEPLQILYTGGTIFHTFLGERIADIESCKLLVKRIAENFRIPYFTITPTFSICIDHGYVVGEHFRCPKCNKPAEVYSRIVGYYRPVQNWHVGKQEEFRQRLEYKPK